MKKKVFSGNELKFIIAVGSSLGLRMLGMTMVMPFISIYGKNLTGNTSFLIAISLGIFGLSQAVFQIPFGSLSDKFGRKKLMIIGMIQLFAGLVLSAMSKDIYTFIISRALQGSGAVNAIVIAWIGDEIVPVKRNRAVSIVGLIMGISSGLAFGLGPFLIKIIDVPSMFLIAAVLALVSLLYITFFIKKDEVTRHTHDEKVNIFEVLKNIKLIKLNISGFFSNFAMLCVFFIVPQLLDESIGAGNMWIVFVPSIIIGVGFMGVSIVLAEKGKTHIVLLVAGVFTATCGVLLFFSNPVIIGIGTCLYMAGMMIFSTMLPVKVTHLTEKRYRGAVNGVFTTLQFFGSFVGSACVGVLWGISKNQIEKLSFLNVINEFLKNEGFVLGINKYLAICCIIIAGLASIICITKDKMVIE